MSFIQTVNEIRGVANSVNPNGRFDHGRVVDASQAFKGAYPFIWLYPFNMDAASGGDFIDDNILLIGFWAQDKPSTSTADREVIIAAMDALAREFFAELQENKLIRILGKVRMEPQYQMYNGTVSGIAARFTYQNFAACD
jgi:hypothetical protein